MEVKQRLNGHQFRTEHEKLQAQSKRVSEFESRVDVLMETLRLARHMQFGASSEKSEETLMEQLSFLFNAVEVFAAIKEEANTAVVAAHKRHKKHEYTLDSIPEDLPRERIEHRLEGEDLVCPQCGEPMTEIGTEVVNKLKIVSAQIMVEQHVYYSYACKSCAETADMGCETAITKTPHGKSVIPGSFTTPEAIAHIIT